VTVRLVTKEKAGQKWKRKRELRIVRECVLVLTGFALAFYIAH